MKELKGKNLQEEFISYLSNHLVVNGVWGGSQTIKAVSLLFEVNILIINENGSFYYTNGFDPNYKKTIMIAYRLSAVKSSPARRNHYDSVGNISVENILVISESLAKKETDELEYNETISDECLINEFKNTLYYFHYFYFRFVPFR